MASNATIKAIESSTVHQIQSGQVIVDLCSVAKELVENSIDAGATNIEVRFKNQGLDAIEVQDNGSGISPQNYASIALKHYTSKLSTYDDLSTLQTFGFRGEALSSLSALSRFSIVTCTQQEAPRATKLEFETSGKLKGTSMVSGQKGTTVFVEELFRTLPVRRRELERNIKREWGKVISLLNQYACVQTGIKFTVSQQPTKGKRMVMFSTKGNPTTRENIINVFGVKTMNALITLDLKLELTPTIGPVRKGKAVEGSTTDVRIIGHVSRPTHGEGRQTPDRQMFYVNGRPCALPQFAKVFNEVYRTYNASQSPFIFADIRLDTHLYDVNVSPDKRTILLHDQGQMLDNLRESLIELFEIQDVTIPVAQTPAQKLTPFKRVAVARDGTPVSNHTRSSKDATVDSRRSNKTGAESEEEGSETDNENDIADEDEKGNAGSDEDEARVVKLSPSSRKRRKRIIVTNPPAHSETASSLSRWLERKSETWESSRSTASAPRGRSTGQAKNTGEISRSPEKQGGPSSQEDLREEAEDDPAEHKLPGTADRGAGNEKQLDRNEAPIAAIPPPSQPPVPRSTLVSPVRPFKRATQELATITIGDHAVTTVIGSPSKRFKVAAESASGSSPISGKEKTRSVPLPSFGGRLTQLFSASQTARKSSVEDLNVITEDVEMPLDEEEGEEEDSLFVSQPAGAIEAEDAGEPPNTTPLRSQIAESEEEEDPKESRDIPGRAASPMESVESTPSESGEQVDEGEEYVDEDEKAKEDKKVAEMIDQIETTAASEPTEDSEKRSKALIKGGTKRKDSTMNLLQQVKVDQSALRGRIATWESHMPQPTTETNNSEADDLEAEDAEEKLSLKISKSDFAKMRIIGQFNLGFILAVREAAAPDTSNKSRDAAENNSNDELFIIDQHASDEKYNFERLQATTMVQSQRLVQPKTLELTAIEEEIMIEHAAALERNGFVVSVDQSGDRPVGSRCRLLSLPLSRETAFSVADLEELVFLLGDNPSGSATIVPRPSKVRKMLAMRACRSSIMIGRALSRRQMEKVVRHMGEMEKPWNCPHGRPTMRHLCGLGAWEQRTWKEGDGFCGRGKRTDWGSWMKERM